MRTRRPSKAFVVVVAIAGLPLAGLSAPASALDPLTEAGFSSDNVEWVKTVPLEADGRMEVEAVSLIIDRYLYVETGPAVHIYDVSEPLNPRHVERIAIPRPMPGPDPVGFNYDWGRFTTNGDILLYPAGDRDVDGYDPNKTRWLHVWDIRDKENSDLIATVPAPGKGPQCILDCRWVYDRDGSIVDLRDPHHPRVTKGNWAKDITFHTGSSENWPRPSELVEVRRGLIVVSSIPLIVLDARKDPVHPRVVARSDGGPLTRGDVAWPARGKSPLLVTLGVGTGGKMTCKEAESDRGTAAESGIATWDASQWKTTGMFTRLDEYHLRNGTYSDGDPAVSGRPTYPSDGGCRFRRFDAHPDFEDRGVIAAGAMRHGVKFLRIDRRGDIKLAGWFVAHQNDIHSALWRTDRIVYGIGWPRGIDILRFKGRI